MLIHSGGGVSETTVFDEGGTHELTEQVYSDGIEARNKAQVNNKPGQALSLSGGGRKKTAVKTSGVGTSVMLEGTEKQKITVDTQAAGSFHGLWAIEKSTLTAKHMEITLQGANDTAVAVQEGAKVDIGNSTLSGTQNQFYGLWAKGKETEVTGHQLKITSQGADSRLVSSYSANITLKDSTLSSIGQNAVGIIAFETAKVTGHHLDIKAEGKGAHAVATNGNATIHLHDSYIQTLATPPPWCCIRTQAPQHRHDSDHHGRVSPCRR